MTQSAHNTAPSRGDTIVIDPMYLPKDGRFGSGPSKIRRTQVQAIENHMYDLLGTSHRQSPVRTLVGDIQEGLTEFFNLPEGYEVVLGNGGATQFWDIACASLIETKASFASFGSFGQAFVNAANSTPFLQNSTVSTASAGSLTLPAIDDSADAYCWPHNETSTGVAAPVTRFAQGHDSNALYLVDATSAAGALPVDISQTDVYYFSPQKAFGSDGGLWIAICSPKAIERAERIESQHNQQRWIPSMLSLRKAVTNSRKQQTLNTPAIATLIFLREQIQWLNEQGGLSWASERCNQSAEFLYSWAKHSRYARAFVQDPAIRSHSVVTLDLDETISADEVCAHLHANGIVDTFGYRKLGRNQLRIGVFPSVEPDDVVRLSECIDWVVAHMTQH